MGLLSGIWNAVDPYLPDEQIMGLLGRRREPQGLIGGGDFMRMAERNGIDPRLMPARPAPAAPPPDRATDGKVGFFDTLMGLKGDESWSAAKERLQQEELTRPMMREAQQGHAQAVADVYRNAGTLTPEQRMALGLNREALGAAFAEGSKPRQTKLMDVNGVLVDSADPNNTGRFIPKLKEGQRPLFDGRGEVIAIQNIDGSVESVAEMEGATTAAQEAAKADYDIIELPLPNGQTVRLPRSVALKALGGGGPQPSQPPAGSPTVSRPALPQGLGLSQSPAEAARQKELAEAEAAAQANLPGVVGKAEEALRVIGELRNHPGRKRGTGLSGVIPPLPGTDTYDFVTALKQAQGQVFLEAFESLKGGGQITQIEGVKGEQAKARLDRAQSEEAFLEALADLESVINSGLTRARQKATPSVPARTAGPTMQGKGYRILSVE